MYMTKRMEIRIPDKMDAAINRKIRLGMYSTKADFVRTAIRNELKRKGVRRAS